MEAEVRYETAEGSPQGGLVSPVLSNIYLNYVIDLWFEKRVRKQARGAAYMVRYADDEVFSFQFEDEAKTFYELLSDRLNQFGLEISEEKSKIIVFGRNADKNDQDKGGHSGRKPETFDFWGLHTTVERQQWKVPRQTENQW